MSTLDRPCFSIHIFFFLFLQCVRKVKSERCSETTLRTLTFSREEHNEFRKQQKYRERNLLFDKLLNNACVCVNRNITTIIFVRFMIIVTVHNVWKYIFSGLLQRACYSKLSNNLHVHII